MKKKIICISVFVLIFILAVQSVSATDADSTNAYSNDFNLDDVTSDYCLSNVDESYSLSDADNSFSLSSSLSETPNENICTDNENMDILEDDGSSEGNSEEEDVENRNLTEISADEITVNYGTEAELKINLTNQDGLGLFNKTIFIQINDVVSNVTTDENGLAIFKYSNSAGCYNLNISFNGDESYAPSTATTKITIGKLSTNLNVPSVRSYLTCSTYVVATLRDSEGHALADKRISLVISGTTYNGTTDSKGIAKIKVPTKVGNFTVSVKFSGDENYSGVSLKSKVVVTKMRTVLIVPVVKSYMTKGTYLKITLKNIRGNALVNKTITVLAGKKTYKLTTNKEGIAKLKFAAKVGTVKCTIKFKETNTYFGASNSSKVIITKMPTFLKAPKITFNSTVFGKLRINLTNIDGKALRNKVITITIPSLKKSYKLKTNEKGIVTFKFNGPKTYNVTIKYAGSKNYVSKSVKTQLVVKKVKVKFNDVVGAANKLNKYIEEKKSLPSEIKYKNHTFTHDQLSYLMAVAIKRIPNKNKDDIVLIATSAPKSSGEIYDTVYKKDYLKIVNKAAGSSLNHKTPGYIKYSFYKVPYKVYTASFSRILTFYKENKKLPNYSLFTNSEFVKVSNSSKYTFYLTTDNIAGKRTDLKMLKKLKKALNSKGYQAVIVGIGPDIHNKAYKYGCTGNNSVLLCCFGGVDVGCIEEWAGELSVGDGIFVKNYEGAHVLGLWYSRPYGASASLKKPVGRAWDANYGFALKNPAKYMSDHKISYIETGTVSSACTLLKSGKMGGPKLIK